MIFCHQWFSHIRECNVQFQFSTKGLCYLHNHEAESIKGIKSDMVSHVQKCITTKIVFKNNKGVVA